MRFQEIFSKKPMLILLVDGLGAILTTLLLVFLVPILDPFWVNLNPFYTILPLISGILAFTSLATFFFFKTNWLIYLRFVVTANIGYCLFSLFILVFDWNYVSILVITYFSLEILIVLLLVYLELTIISAHKKSNR
jgi:hypothetical protein